PAMAWLRRSASAPVSQPSFDTGTSASFTPVIAATAASRAWATAACETMTPRRGSLIVFLEVFLQLAALGKSLEEPVVERACRIHSAVAQQVVHRHDLAHDREVLARIERHGHERQRHLDEARRLAGEAGAILLARGIPAFALDDDFHSILLATPAGARPGKADYAR